MNDKKMLSAGLCYTFTLNPCDECQFMKKRRDRDVYVTEALQATLGEIKKHFKYILVPEISHKGRYHFHGYIEIINVSQFYLYAIPKLMGFSRIEIDTIKDHQIWANYIYKNREIMEPLTEVRWHGYVLTHETPSTVDLWKRHRDNKRAKNKWISDLGGTAGV